MNKYIGSDFDDFLSEEGLLEEVEASAIKTVVAYQIGEAMKQQKLTKADLAKRMHASPNTVARLFDPSNGLVQLSTLERAACAVGKKLKLDLL